MSRAEALETCCGLFHGYSSDGAQLMHVMNVLGTPTPADMDAMRIVGACRLCLEAIVAAMPHAAPTASAPSDTLSLCAFLSHRHMPVDVAHVLARMLTWDPSARLTAADALWHPALLMTSPSESSPDELGAQDAKTGFRRHWQRPLTPVVAVPPALFDEAADFEGFTSYDGHGAGVEGIKNWLMSPIEPRI